MVWPKFKIARSPPSVSSWPHTSALNFAAARHHIGQRFWFAAAKVCGRSRFEPREKVRVGNDAYLMTSARPARYSRTGRVFKRVEIAQHEPRLVKSATRFFPGLQIDTRPCRPPSYLTCASSVVGTCTNATPRNICRRDKPARIRADHRAPSATMKDLRFQPVLREQVVAGLDGFSGFWRFRPAGTTINEGEKPAVARELKAFWHIPFANIGVRDDGAAGAQFQARAFPAELIKQTRAIFDRVAAISQLNGNGAHVTR